MRLHLNFDRAAAAAASPAIPQGYAFCEFADPNSIGNVITGLHMQTFERKVRAILLLLLVHGQAKR